MLRALPILCITLSLAACGQDKEPEVVTDAGGGGPVFGDGASSTKCYMDTDCAAWAKVCNVDSGLCVDCLVPAHCPSGQACQSGTCLPDHCEDGRRLCKSLRVAAVCKGDGSGFEVTNCKDEAVCVDGKCKSQLCVPDSVTCNGAGSARLVCNHLGDAQSSKPCPGGSVCVAGGCLTKVCSPGKTGCQGGDVVTCSEDGSAWETTPCAEKESCDPGYGSGGIATCKGWACTPGDGFCVDGKAMACGKEGLDAEPVGNCNELDSAGKPQVCVAGKCMSVKCQPGAFVCVSWTSLGKCGADGQTWVKTPCGEDFVCDANKCVAAVCAAGKGYCEDGLAMLCNALGSKGQMIENCKVQALDCAAGKCGLSKCIPGVAVCSKDKSTLLVCDAFGQKQLKQPCPQGQYCLEKKCVKTICPPEAASCKEGIPQLCSADGTALLPQPACGKDAACVDGLCAKKDCNPGKKKCQDVGSVLVCNKNGVGWAATPCPAKEVCLSGACKAQLCAPATAWCDGAVAKTCDITGLAIANTVDCKKAGKTCKGGICVDKGCGDGECTKGIGENCTSCAKDCGACPPDGCKALPTAGCQNCACQQCVCDFDGTCCSQAWSGLCATLCETACTNTCK